MSSTFVDTSLQFCDIYSPPPPLTPVLSLTDLVNSGEIRPMDAPEARQILSKIDSNSSLRSALSQKLSMSRNSSLASVKGKLSREGSEVGAMVRRQLSQKMSLTGLITGAVQIVHPSSDAQNTAHTPDDNQNDGEEGPKTPLIADLPLCKPFQDNSPEEADEMPGDEMEKSEEAQSDSDMNDTTSDPVMETNESDNEQPENSAAADDTREADNDVDMDTEQSTDNAAMDTEQTKENASEDAAPPAGPAPIEIVISFDTTGSMSSCIEAVKENVKETIQRLFMDIPSLKIAVLAHGDYCDKDLYYLTRFIDFTNDVESLCRFVTDVEATGGGDFPECYEFILQEVRTKFSWTPGTRKSLVMIGDAIPHEVNDANNESGLDWRQEAFRLFHDLGAQIYAVQCLDNNGVSDFWKGLAEITSGKHLKLDQFRTIVDIIMAICYREMGAMSLQAFEMEVRQREGACIRPELNNLFTALNRNEPRKKPLDLSKGARKASNKKPVVAKKVRVTPVPKLSTAKAAKIARVRPTALPPTARKNTTVKQTVKAKPTKLRLGKSFRESASETTFLLRNLNWCPWKLAMAPEAPKCEKDAWAPRRGGHVGMRKTTLFKDDSQGKPALYEVAVQPQSKSKRYVMYLTSSTGCPSNLHWDTHLLKHPDVVRQIDNVLDEGCKIFIRKCVVLNRPKRKLQAESAPTLKEVRRFCLKNYDYAWNRNHGPAKTRYFYKKGVTFSMTTFVEH